METTPRFINGVFAFNGAGLATPRGGNSSDELVAVSLMRDGKPMRTFPIGAKAGIHVPLAVVEDLMPDSRIEVFIGAPDGVSGQIVLDIGMLEI